MLCLPLTTAQTAKPVPTHFQKAIFPLLTRNCYACHNEQLKSGDLSLVPLKNEASIAADPEAWEKIATKLRDGTMPPKGAPRPSQADVESVSTWIQAAITRAELAAKPDPGHVTARRLNRVEYNNTIRDLFGVDFRPADDFPQDDSGYGFDNIGDVLSMSPVLLGKYLRAAESIVETAINGPRKTKPTAIRSQPPGHDFPLFPKAKSVYDVTGLSMPNALHATMRFPSAGEYRFRAALEGRRPTGSEPVHIGIWVDGKQVATLDIDAPSDGGSIDLFGAQAETRLRLPAGEHWIAASPLRLYEGLPASYGGPNPTKRPVPPPRDPFRNLRIPPDATPEKIAEIKQQAAERAERFQVPANRLWVHWVEALGPYNDNPAPSPEVRKRIFPCGHSAKAHLPACDRTILSNFARRAFRRPVPASQLQPYLDLATSSRRKGSSFEEAIGASLQAILVSPDFLFRIESTEPTTNAASDVGPVTQSALASRLSYFLWSSMPDEELLRAAAQRTLRNPDVLAAQVKRMLLDPKSRALVENFAGQWLELRRLESVTPDREKFPVFDDYLRMSMRQETDMFFANMIRNDLKIVDLLNANYTFVNEKLADFYGIAGVQGPEFRKVELAGTPRGGILTHAGILTVTSYANRTSPVLRGKWILENFLNEAVPPPPPDVPVLDEATIGASGSMRQQMEQHRVKPICSSCHAKMDPIGFGFENYNAIGQWRTKDGKFPIDPAGALPDGRTFQGPDDLRVILAADQEKFAEAVTEKLLTYALGRGLERYDRRTVKEIARRVADADYRFSALVMEIVKSLPFQMARQDRKKT